MAASMPQSVGRGASFRASTSSAHPPLPNLASRTSKQEQADRREKRQGQKRRRPMPTMKRLERGMRSFQVARRKVSRGGTSSSGQPQQAAGDATAPAPPLPAFQEEIALSLHAPGQRGIVQVMLQGKRDLATTLPLLKRVQEDSRVIKKRRVRQQHVKGKVTKQVHNVLVFCQNALAEWNVLRGAAAEEEEKKQRGRTTTRAPDASATVTLVPDPVTVLQNIIKGVRNVEKLREKEAELDGDDEELAAQVARANRLAEELKKQSDRQLSMATSFMNTKYNKDAATAVGRGPPGGIAFSPFTSHDPMFEREEVVQTIIDNNRRAVATRH